MAFTLEELYNMQNDKIAGKPAEAKPDEADADADTAVGLPAISAEDVAKVRELESQLQELSLERDVLRERLDQSSGAAADPFQEEMIELLKSEVTQLQSELNQRDARISELSDSDEPSSSEPIVDDVELEKLCSRLEELLTELDDKDEELTVLNQQLLAAEDANHAEQNERRQLENWVEEIEERVTARDEEWETKLEDLQDRLTQAQEDRRETESVASEASTDARVESLQRLVTTLRDAKDELLDQLDSERENAKQLQRQVEELKASDEREESVKLCQERADIARQRFEVEKLRREMEEQKAVQGSDLRIRALRDHLKEVHDQEEEERREAWEKSLAGRVANLWKRLG